MTTPRSGFVVSAPAACALASTARRNCFSATAATTNTTLSAWTPRSTSLRPIKSGTVLLVRRRKISKLPIQEHGGYLLLSLPSLPLRKEPMGKYRSVEAVVLLLLRKWTAHRLPHLANVGRSHHPPPAVRRVVLLQASRNVVLVGHQSLRTFLFRFPRRSLGKEVGLQRHWQRLLRQNVPLKKVRRGVTSRKPPRQVQKKPQGLKPKPMSINHKKLFQRKSAGVDEPSSVIAFTMKLAKETSTYDQCGKCKREQKQRGLN